jgi:hypothetical protein
MICHLPSITAQPTMPFSKRQKHGNRHVIAMNSFQKTKLLIFFEIVNKNARNISGASHFSAFSPKNKKLNVNLRACS